MLQPWVLQVVRLLELAVPLALVLGGQSVIACPTWFCLHCHLRFELAEALPQSVVESPLVALRVLLAHLLALVVPRVLVLEVLSVTAYPTWFCLHCLQHWVLAEGLLPQVAVLPLVLVVHLLASVVPRVLVLGVLSETAYPT